MHGFPFVRHLRRGDGISSAMDDRQRPTRTRQSPLSHPPSDDRQRQGTPPTRHSGAVDVTALIRSLQRAEGQDPCFRTGLSACDQKDCPWRGYCVDSTQGPSKPGPDDPAA